MTKSTPRKSMGALSIILAVVFGASAIVLTYWKASGIFFWVTTALLIIPVRLGTQARLKGDRLGTVGAVLSFVLLVVAMFHHFLV